MADKTLETKFAELISTKSKIANIIQIKGVPIPKGLKFNDWDILIDQITSVEATTEDVDLLMMIDIADKISETQYIENNYTESELTQITELLDKIVLGEDYE